MKITIINLDGKKLEFEARRVQVTNVKDYSGNPSEEIEKCEIRIVDCTCEYSKTFDFIGEVYRAKEGFSLQVTREHEPNNPILFGNLKPTGYVQSSDETVEVIAFEKAVFTNHVPITFN